jgi:hypothetical protein
MFGFVKTKKSEIREKTVYMEIYGENKVAYKVLSVRMNLYGDDIITYGIEVVDHISGDKEIIPDFSHNIEDAVSFADELISAKIRPRQLYGKALGFLRVSI